MSDDLKKDFDLLQEQKIKDEELINNNKKLFIQNIKKNKKDLKNNLRPVIKGKNYFWKFKIFFIKLLYYTKFLTIFAVSKIKTKRK